MKKLLITPQGERLIEVGAANDLRRIGGHWLLSMQDNRVVRIAQANGQLRVNGKLADMQLADPRDVRRDGTGGGAEGRSEVRAAMPGKVVQVLAAPGADVIAGDGLLTLEAMKMQNEVRAPRDGRVKTVHVEPGATVSSGQVLVTLE